MNAHAPRRATIADAPACVAIIRAWVETTDWMPDPPSDAKLLRAFEVGIPMREFWVSGSPVLAYLSLDPLESLIHGLYSAAPGAGHGKALLDQVKQGRDFLQLWTHEPNTAAQRFYKREGFSVVERKAEGRGDGVPELRMEWRTT